MSQIDELIAEFVTKLRAAIASEAAAAFAIAGGGGQPDPLIRRKPGPKPGTPRIAAAPKKKGGKRTAEDIEAQGKAIMAFLKKNPSQNAETIGPEVGLSTAELSLPMSKLIKQKAVKHVGEKRGRLYSVK